MVDKWIKCPGCSRKVVEVERLVSTYFDPNFSCKCGYKGGLSWTRTKT